MVRNIALILLTLVLMISALDAAAVFKASDRPSDDGKAVDLTWQLPAEYTSIRIEKLDSTRVWTKIATPLPSETFYSDSDAIEPDLKYEYRLIAFSAQPADSLVLLSAAVPLAQWFDFRKLPLLILLLILCGAVIFYIISARSGKDLFIRRINGLESMDEAVGRATEKGKPILFVPGIGDLDDIQTIAALTILSQLAYKAATYNADLIVPVSKSMVLSTAREVIKEAYLKAGRPDAFRPDCVFYLTDDQFGYVAGIDGIMLREKPAANFFLGTFYAEALILAETGFGTGAMQTAGTAQPHQLPFFVVSCDYTLIGEELFAASAYLSKEPNQLGSLKGQDFGKFIIVLLIIVGSIMEMTGYHWLKNILMLE
jgi:hypothetical protein